MTNDERIQAVETTLTHQARQIEDLSDMLILQGKEIAALKRKLALADEHVAELRASLESGPKPTSVTEEALLNKPPHY